MPPPAQASWPPCAKDRGCHPPERSPRPSSFLREPWGPEAKGSPALRKGRASAAGRPPRAPYLEGGVLLHVPQQLGLLGRRVVAHRALELLPWEEGRAGKRSQVPPPVCTGTARPGAPAPGGRPAEGVQDLGGTSREGCRRKAAAGPPPVRELDARQCLFANPTRTRANSARQGSGTGGGSKGTGAELPRAFNSRLETLAGVRTIKALCSTHPAPTR